MTVSLLGEGTNVVFLSGIGYKNKQGQVKYDVTAGAKGVIRKGRVTDGKALYDVELSVGKTLTQETIVHDVEGTIICPAVVDIVKTVETFPRKPKKDRPWRKFTTEELEAFATAKGVEWKKNENEKVNRMFLVKALDDSGLEAPKDIGELWDKIG